MTEGPDNRGDDLSPSGRELLESLLKRQQALERDLEDVRRALAESMTRQSRDFDLVNMSLSQLQAFATEAHHNTRMILNSLIWRTLARGGGALLQMQEAVRNIGGLKLNAGRWRELRVSCEEPAGSVPRSGLIEIRGWAVSRHGIDRVEVLVDHGPAGQPRYGLYRPDVARAFPQLPDGDRSGFSLKFDTAALSNGQHWITVRARDAKNRTAEDKVPLVVDHAHGFPNDYARWQAEFEQRDPELVRLVLAGMRNGPGISVIVPVYKTRPEFLERAILSVLGQSYPNWELCLADDCSGSPEIDALLERYARQDARIRCVHLPENRGISAASNAALDLATGELVALLDHDDELAPDALFHVVEALNANPEADIVYSDEDHIDEAGTRSDPFFKPDWSPNLILSENYVCHLLVFRRALAESVGRFRGAADVSQDHDILLRMSLQARKIVHIPRVLYHWRTVLDTSNRASEASDKAFASSREAVENYLRLAKIDATVEPGRYPGRWRVRYALHEKPLVSIIIPSGGQLDVLRRNLDTLAGITDYPNYEIVLADNSKGGQIADFARSWSVGGRRVRYMDWRHRPFNYSEINNAAVRTCEAPLLLFLNDDTAPIDAGWLTALVEHACRPEVGAVGARLLYPDGRIQHAGVVMGVLGICGHAFKGMFGDQRIYFDFPDVIRDVSSLTAACLMIPAKVFHEVGGFDEAQFPVAYNDVDLTLKIGRKGYQLIYTPHAALYHYEAFSKSSADMDPRPVETAALRSRWKELVARDPFYSPNLTVTAEDYSLRKRA